MCYIHWPIQDGCEVRMKGNVYDGYLLADSVHMPGAEIRMDSCR